MRGVVYQLPARKGRPRFVAGYEDPWNVDAACLSFDIYEGEPGFFSMYPADNPDSVCAAQWADGIVERMAESERERNRAWQAGRKYDYKGEELGELRKATLDLIRQFKKFRNATAAALSGEDLGACLDALYDKIADNVERMCTLKTDRAELLYWFGDCDGFHE